MLYFGYPLGGSYYIVVIFTLEGYVSFIIFVNNHRNGQLVPDTFLYGLDLYLAMGNQSS